MGSVRSHQTGPASSASTTRMIEIPVRSSPAMIARCVGAAPRHRGSREACTLSGYLNSANTEAGRICPYAATTIKSAWSSVNALSSLSDRKFSGCLTSTPAASARSLIALWRDFRPRPAGRSGWV